VQVAGETRIEVNVWFTVTLTLLVVVSPEPSSNFLHYFVPGPLASYYFHPFWKLEGQAQQEQMIHFMKNLSMIGAMLFIVANGSGPMSVDSLLRKRTTAPADERETFAHTSVA
jgi:hypothetical protein